MPKRLAIPALLMAGLLVFTACGDDDDDSNASGAAAADEAVEDSSAADDDAGTDTSAAGDDAGTEGSTDGDEASTDESTDESADDGASDEEFSGDDSGDFCDFMADAQDQVELEVFDGSVSGDELRDQFGEARDALDSAVDRAPDEIRGDVETLADVFVQLDDLLAEFDYDFSQLAAQATEDPEAFAEFEAIASDERFNEASERVDAYLTDVCGIDTSGE
jgi:hypothetical protein